MAAHRGGAAERPENTLSAFRNAIARGVHQVELDVRRSADGALVVIHDDRIDRTTNGWGVVRSLSLAQLRRLDAGAPGVGIPTLEEALDVLPRDLWINVQIKRGEPIAEEVARAIVHAGREDQAFVAAGNDACRRVRRACSSLRVCNLARQRSRSAYLSHAIAQGASFVQFHHQRGPMEPDLADRARRAGLRVNFMCAPNADVDELDALFRSGVDFVLVDDLEVGLEAARRVGVAPLARLGARVPGSVSTLV